MITSAYKYSLVSFFARQKAWRDLGEISLQIEVVAEES